MILGRQGFCLTSVSLFHVTFYLCNLNLNRQVTKEHVLMYKDSLKWNIHAFIHELMPHKFLFFDKIIGLCFTRILFQSFYFKMSYMLLCNYLWNFWANFNTNFFQCIIYIYNNLYSLLILCFHFNFSSSFLVILLCAFVFFKTIFYFNLFFITVLVILVLQLIWFHLVAKAKFFHLIFIFNFSFIWIKKIALVLNNNNTVAHKFSRGLTRVCLQVGRLRARKLPGSSVCAGAWWVSSVRCLWRKQCLPHRENDLL